MGQNETTMQNGIFVMTQKDLDEYTGKIIAAVRESGVPKEERTAYVYGLKGIKALFGVSHTTAQRYKNTFLAPAVTQRGKKLVVDVAKAMDLFNAKG